VNTGERRTARIAGPVQAAVNDRRFAANVFHDVDLSASGPTHLPDIRSEHPECRPDALSERHFYAGLDSAVTLAEFVFGKQSCRSIVAPNTVLSSEALLEKLDYKMSVAIEKRVVAAAGIGFKLVVAPAVAPHVVVPLRLIGNAAGRAIEFISPAQRVAL